jgi:hypothetical protein
MSRDYAPGFAEAFRDYRNAVNAQYEALLLHGVESERFANAEAKADAAWKRVHELSGKPR